MASTLTTRVVIGVGAVGLVAFFILWKKFQKEKPKEPKKPTTSEASIIQNGIEEIHRKTALGDASDTKNLVDTGQEADSSGQSIGQVTETGDAERPENYVCENGVCRLVKAPKTSKTRHKVRFDPLDEFMNQSLSEYFEGRSESDSDVDKDSVTENIGQKSTDAEIVRKEVVLETWEADVVTLTQSDNKNTDDCEYPARTQCVEAEVHSTEGHVVSNEPRSDSEEGLPEEDVTEDTWEAGRYEEEDMSMAILVSQNSPGILSSSNAEVLVGLLSHPDTKLQQAALNGIKKSSTFTRNQNLFREHGCLEKLGRLLRSQSMSLRLGVKSSQEVVSSVATAITNLSANTENHKNFEGCVPTLVDLTLEDETGESVCLSSLQALTNLSLTDQYHRHYTRLVQKLYDLLDCQQHNIQLQALKILVNLSCSTEMVPHILAAKAPGCLHELLKQGTDEALILRMTTFLANVLHTVKEENLSVSSLPPDDKAASPETMHAALYSMNNIGPFKSKVFLLCRHRNEEIKAQATRIYQSIAK